MKQLKKLKLFLFSKLSIIFLLLIFFIINSLAFFAEYRLGKIDLETTKWVRFLSIFFEFVIVGFGLLMWAQIRFRKSQTVRAFFKFISVKSLFWIYLLADGLAIFFSIYLFYVARLFLFWYRDRITPENIKNGAIIAFIGVLLFGFVNIFIRYIKKRIRRINTSKEWILLMYNEAGFFYSPKSRSNIIPIPIVNAMICNEACQNLFSLWSSGIKSDPAI